MTPLRFAACALALFSTPAAGQAERPTAPIAQLPKAPKLDGDLEELSKGRPLFENGAIDSVQARAGLHGTTLYLGVRMPDEQVTPADQVFVSLFFPGAGMTASGHTFRFGPDGKRSSTDPLTPSHAQAAVNANVKSDAHGWTLEASIPARGLPRLPASGPMVLELCVKSEDADAPGATVETTSNCTNGTMKTALVLPGDKLRRELKLKPPASVQGLEARPNGWVGYGLLPSPDWAQGDSPLDVQSLRSLVSDRSIDPESANLGIPPLLRLADGRPLFSVVTGKDPYAVEGQCNREDELRLALYVVKGKTADRVLEWPVANCAFGRATSLDLDEEGTLTIGYSNGSTVSFVWSKDHFERTEIGSR